MPHLLRRKKKPQKEPTQPQDSLLEPGAGNERKADFHQSQQKDHESPDPRSEASRNQHDFHRSPVAAKSLKTSTVAARPDAVPQADPQPQDLWDRAYRLLRDDKVTEKLLKNYEQILLSEVKDGNTSQNLPDNLEGFDKQKHLSALVAEQLQIMDNERWNFHVGNETVEVKAQFDRVVKFVLFAKDFVSSAVSSDPHAALAWTGVCVLLPLLLNPSLQQKGLVHGLDHISDMICHYTTIEEIYRKQIMDASTFSTASAANSGQVGEADLHSFQNCITKLYAKIIEYQAKAVLYFRQSRLIKYSRDVLKIDDWVALLADVNEADTACRAYLPIIDAATLKKGREDQALQMETLYSAFVSRLERLQQSLEDVSRATISNTQEHAGWRRSDKEAECLQVLYNSDYQAFKARNPDRVKGTCEWFLRNAKYKNWMEKQSSDLLWVTADPGCGKSVLSKSLIDNEFQDLLSTITCYFFFKDDSSDQKSVSKAICALLHQILSRCDCHAMLQKAVDVYRVHGSKMSESLDLLWSLLLDIVQHPEAGQIVCVLDALDECEMSGRKRLIRHLNSFTSVAAEKNAQFKFLVTSRPYSTIEDNFNRELTKRLSGEDETELIKSEINLVIEARVPQVATQLRLDAITKEVLRQRLLDMKNRTYLWLHLTLENVVKQSPNVKTPRRMKKVLDKIPATVYEAYEQMLGHSQYPEKARKLLQIVLAAERPLTLREMNMALHIEEGDTSPEDIDLSPEDGFEADIKNICGLFVSIFGSKVYFLHQTAKEFLLSREDRYQIADQKNSDGRTWQHSMDCQLCDLVLARSCLTYLLLSAFEKGPLDKDTSSPPRILFDYASCYWTHHFGRAGEDEKLRECWLTVCDIQSARFHAWFKVYWKCNRYQHFSYAPKAPSALTPLMVASIFGHQSMVEQIFENSELQLVDSRGRTALHYTVGGGYINTAQFLLEKGAAQVEDESGYSPLYWAARSGHDKMVGLFVDHDAVIESLNADWRSPLTAAARFGHVNAVKLLLERGSAIERKDEDGNTSLALAARRGQEDVVKLLLQRNAQVESINNQKRTPLSMAAESGEREIVKLLLKEGAQVESRDGKIKSPLSGAAEEGHAEVVKLLLENGAEADARDNNRRATLSFAAERGHAEIVKLLLENGVEADARDDNRRAPLSFAAEEGHAEVVKLLLKNGAEADARDPNGQTPLSFAAEEGHAEIVKLLLENDAEADVRDANRQTPLSFAAERGHAEIVKQLLAKSAQVDSTDKWHRTPLSRASGMGHATTVNLLLENNAAVDSKDKNDRTPLSFSAERADEEVIKLLLQKGAQINSMDRDGVTALMIAAQRGSANTIRFLLANGASLNDKDRLGRTALYYAVASGCNTISDFSPFRRKTCGDVMNDTVITAKTLQILETKPEERESTEKFLELSCPKPGFSKRYKKNIWGYWESVRILQDYGAIPDMDFFRDLAQENSTEPLRD